MESFLSFLFFIVLFLRISLPISIVIYERDHQQFLIRFVTQFQIYYPIDWSTFILLYNQIFYLDYNSFLFFTFQSVKTNSSFGTSMCEGRVLSHSTLGTGRYIGIT